MKSLVFAVYDSKLQAFMLPWIAQNEQMAKRNFATVANDPGTQLCEHAEDFALYQIGTFEDETGHLEAVVPHNLGFASNYKVRRHGENASEQVGNEAPVLGGSKGGNSAKHV